VNHRIVVWSALAIAPVLLAAAGTAAASDAERVTTLASAASPTPSGWLVRAEGSLVGLRDSWLSLPRPEVGLTLGRTLTPRFSVELTGSAREVGDDQRRSWSGLAAARWVVLASPDGRHALTVAGGPFLEIDNPVHGTLPFAHGEAAYVFRAPRGLTLLAGAGLNVALASSPYVPPPSPCEAAETGDSPTFCVDLGPDAQEIHAGDAIAHFRFAVGWQF
jgi:hypothetical protein